MPTITGLTDIITALGPVMNGKQLGAGPTEPEVKIVARMQLTSRAKVLTGRDIYVDYSHDGDVEQAPFFAATMLLYRTLNVALLARRQQEEFVKQPGLGRLAAYFSSTVMAMIIDCNPDEVINGGLRWMPGRAELRSYKIPYPCSDNDTRFFQAVIDGIWDNLDEYYQMVFQTMCPVGLSGRDQFLIDTIDELLVGPPRPQWFPDVFKNERRNFVVTTLESHGIK